MKWLRAVSCGTCSLLLLVVASHTRVSSAVSLARDDGNSSVVAVTLAPSPEDTEVMSEAGLLDKLRDWLASAQTQGLVSVDMANFLAEGTGWDLPAASASVPSLLRKRGSSQSDSNQFAGHLSDPQLKSILEKLEAGIKSAYRKTEKRLQDLVDNLGDECSSSPTSKKWKRKYQEGVQKHTTCRKDEEVIMDNLQKCNDHVGTLHKAREKACNSKILQEQPNPKICVPEAPPKNYGEWLKSNMEKFEKKYKEWEKEVGECKAAAGKIKEMKCNTDEDKKRKKAEECEGVLKSLEGDACTWAKTKQEACVNYDDCFDKEKVRYADEVKASTKKDTQRKASWQIAQKFRCLMESNSPGGEVDEAALNACMKKYEFPEASAQIKIPPFPTEKKCPAPKTYPGSKAYKEAVYDPLPKTITVKQPGPCPHAPKR